MDDYAQYLYQEKGTELTHLPLETVQTALKEADLM
ncbi:dCMP deaminase [Streptococcus pneumoniae]|nr:dCMP deaminase [Streptococcus pneumoniae]